MFDISTLHVSMHATMTTIERYLCTKFHEEVYRRKLNPTRPLSRGPKEPKHPPGMLTTVSHILINQPVI